MTHGCERRRRSELRDPNLTPLLDVVLQLIMFFMITVNFVAAERSSDESMHLPVVQSTVPRLKDDKDKKEMDVLHQSST